MHSEKTGKDADDVVIVSAVRTPITGAKRGAFKDVQPEYLLSAALKGVCDRARVPYSLVDDIVVGSVLAPGGGAIIARMAMFHAGFPQKTTICTINRQCSSGLQAVASIASAIKAGYIDVGIGAGVESMTMNYGAIAMPTSISEQVIQVKEAADCLIPMGITSENVATQFGITREEQDKFAVESHSKAFKAQNEGKYEEIVPVRLGTSSQGLVVSEDDGIRKETSMQALAKLKTSFKENGTTTAGNSSQVSDGAAAVLLMRRSTAINLGLQILGKFVDFAVAGVPPRIMGIGPALAIPKLLKQNSLSIGDIGVFELNEAFASQASHCAKVLGIPAERWNPLGGAIALGHPLGCTGSRLVATILPQMRKRKIRYGVVSMCIGTGMGAAALIELEYGSNGKGEEIKGKL